MGRQAQKIWTADPRLRRFIEDFAKTIRVPGRGADSIGISAAVLAFSELPPERQAEYVRRIVMPEAEAAIQAVEQAAAPAPTPPRPRKASRRGR